MSLLSIFMQTFVCSFLPDFSSFSDVRTTILFLNVPLVHILQIFILVPFISIFVLPIPFTWLGHCICFSSVNILDSNLVSKGLIFVAIHSSFNTAHKFHIHCLDFALFLFIKVSL